MEVLAVEVEVLAVEVEVLAVGVAVLAVEVELEAQGLLHYCQYVGVHCDFSHNF